MDVKQTALDLIGPIYDAANDADMWPLTLERVSDAVESNGAVLAIMDRRLGISPLFIGVGTDRNPHARLERHQREYADIDPWNKAFARQPELVPCVTQAIIPVEEFTKTKVYLEFYKALDHVCAVGVALLQEPQFYGGVSFFRGRAQPPFEEDAIELLEIIGPHMQRAFQFNNRLAAIEGKWSGASEALNRMPIGVVLVDTDRRIVFINDAAQTIVASESDLSVNDNRLVAMKSDDTTELWRLIDCNSRCKTRPR